MNPRTLLAIALTVTSLTAVSACSPTSAGNPAYAQPVDAFTVSDTIGRAAVVGVGEATHDGRQTTQLRLALLRQLVERHGFRTFALEDRFGPATAVDAYIQGGPGTAREVVEQNLFGIYRNAQFVEIVQWLRDHNDHAPTGDRVRFVGVDPRGCGSAAQRAADALRPIDVGRAEAVLAANQGCTDDNESAQPAAVGAARRAAFEQLGASLAGIGDRGHARELTLAREAVAALTQGAELQADAGKFQQARERFLADGVGRAVDLGGGRGVLYAAHNGHVDKGGAAYGHPSAGKLLHQRFGDSYRSIGTDFATAVVYADQRGRGDTVTISRTSGLAGLVRGSGYVDTAQAFADPANRALLAGKVRMGSVGTPFARWQAWLEPTRSVEQVPARDFDAVVVFDRLEATDRF